MSSKIDDNARRRLEELETSFKARPGTHDFALRELFAIARTALDRKEALLKQNVQQEREIAEMESAICVKDEALRRCVRWIAPVMDGFSIEVEARSRKVVLEFAQAALSPSARCEDKEHEHYSCGKCR